MIIKVINGSEIDIMITNEIISFLLDTMTMNVDSIDILRDAKYRKLSLCTYKRKILSDSRLKIPKDRIQQCDKMMMHSIAIFPNGGRELNESN